jgi:hypothetical protein
MPRSRFGWVLWIVMLLPAAQFAAVWHACSHAAQTERREDQRAIHPAHCDLCLTAANLAGGGLPADIPGLPACTGCEASASVRVVSVASVPPTPAYLGRAPPLPLL